MTTIDEPSPLDALPLALTRAELEEILAASWESGLMTLVVATLVVALLVLIDRLQRRGAKRLGVPRFRRHLTMLGLTLIGALVVIVSLPSPTDEQVLRVFGLLLSAAIAFSSTTLVGNGMAGLMLRAQRHFRAGDFIKVDSHFGQVYERGLFFTEVQNEARDMVTLPNSYLIKQPVTVISGPDTVISAEVTLGYDVPRRKVQRLLLSAAKAAKLTDGWVQIMSLGDFSIRYRVCGLLTEVQRLPTRESELRGRIVDSLHRGGVEIVSPTFMHQRVLPADQPVIPPVEATGAQQAAAVTPEAVMFDRAQEAAAVERLEDLIAAVGDKIEALRAELKDGPEPDRRREIEERIERFERRQEWLTAELDQRRDAAAQRRG